MIRRQSRAVHPRRRFKEHSVVERRRQQRLAGTLPEINARQLAAVRAVAEYRSFIAAAAHLGISQPALTLAIKRLEATLGLRLFDRSTRRVAITAAGREFVAMAERVLTDLKLGMQNLDELAERRRGQVIVTSLIHLPMSDVIAEYVQRFPGIEVQLREGPHEQVEDDVRSGLVDFGVGNLGGLPPQFVTESLGREAQWVVMRRDHPLARLRQVELQALREVALVSLPVGSTTRRLVDGAAAAAGFRLRHLVTAGLPWTLFRLVSAGVGVSIGPANPLRWGAARTNLLSRPLVRPKIFIENGIIRLRDRELSPAAAELLALASRRLRPRELSQSEPDTSLTKRAHKRTRSVRGRS
jgi:DNA-binding transcriptional LysR family regulator